MLAEADGVCGRTLVQRVTDTTTGQAQLVPIRCGSTREAVCPTCAQRNRRLRMQQCREGWHLDTEPEESDDIDELDDGGAYVVLDDGGDLPEPSRRVRSTRRRQDAPDLPRRSVEPRTIGKVFEAPDGRRFPAVDARNRHCCVARSGRVRDWCHGLVLGLRVRWFPVSS